MNAIFNGKLYRMGDNMVQVELIDDVEADGSGAQIWVSWGDGDLVIDPTDDEIINILPDYFESKGLIVDAPEE